MAWTMNVNWIESCSCASMCPCILGPAKPDQGWCSAVFGIEVTQGDSDGVDLSGAVFALGVEMPGDFLGGIDKAKLYFDPSLSDAQRSELDAIFQGQKGGVWAGINEGIAEWLPSTVAPVDVSSGDSPGVKVEGFGQVVLEPIVLEDGTPTQISDPPILAAFGMQSLALAFAHGTSFSDPDMRSWESLGHGGVITNLVWTS